MQLYYLSSPEIDRLSRDTIVVIPFAAVEQHSVHLPTGTDSIIAEAICRRLDAKLHDEILVLPVTWLGCSRHHMGFAGSLTASGDTFCAVAEDIVTSMAEHGFRKFILLNSHGGNISRMSVLAEELHYKLGGSAKIVGCTYWHLIGEDIKSIRDSEIGGMGHACELETSLMLAEKPATVLTGLLDPDGPKNLTEYETADMFAGGKVALTKTYKQLTKHGGFGDPTLASAEKGERIFAVIIKRLMELVAAMQDGRL